jgi:hypothetical protein
VCKLSTADFLSRFTVVYKSATGAISTVKGSSTNPLAQEAINKIAQLIASTPLDQIIAAAPKPKKGSPKNRTSATGAVGKVKNKKAAKNAKGAPKITLAMKLDALFAALDADGSGELDEAEFTTGLKCLPGLDAIELSNGQKVTDKKMLSEVTKIADRSGDGQISLLELLEAFVFEDSGGEDMGNSLAEHMLTVLFRHRQALRAGSRCIDSAGLGRVARDDFFKVLMALNKALTVESDTKSVLLESQVADLCDALSQTNSGFGAEIVYEDFFNSFVVTDRENPSIAIRLGRKSVSPST